MSWQAVAVCGESRMHGGNGGDGKTQFGCASCPYPLGKPPKGQAWLRDRMVSSNEADFNLRGMRPPSQYLARWDGQWWGALYRVAPHTKAVTVG
jgi:hypothetical protein